jgi:general secretion pathway protein G
MKWERPVIYGLLAILVLLFLTEVIPRCSFDPERARRMAAHIEVGNFSVALDTFKLDNGAYPKSLEEMVTRPPVATNWRGPYFWNEVPLDPWLRSYFYVYPGKHNTNSFDLMSAGPDGRAGTDDDITNWQSKL